MSDVAERQTRCGTDQVYWHSTEVKMAHGHSEKTNNTEFMRTHPRVLDNTRVALEHTERLNQEKHVLTGNLFDLPTDVKQVRNLGR